MAILNTKILEDTKNLVSLYNKVPRFRKAVDTAIAEKPETTYQGRPVRLYLEVITKVSPKYKKYYKGVKTPLENYQKCFEEYYQKDFYQLENTLTQQLNTKYSDQEIATMEEIETSSKNWNEKRKSYQEHYNKKDGIKTLPGKDAAQIKREINEEDKQKAAYFMTEKIRNYGGKMLTDADRKNLVNNPKAILSREDYEKGMRFTQEEIDAILKAGLVKGAAGGAVREFHDNEEWNKAVYQTASEHLQSQFTDQSMPTPSNTPSFSSFRNIVSFSKNLGETLGPPTVKAGSFALRSGGRFLGGAAKGLAPKILGGAAKIALGVGTGGLATAAMAVASVLPIDKIFKKATVGLLKVTGAAIGALVLFFIANDQIFVPGSLLRIPGVESADLEQSETPPNSLDYTIPLRNSAVRVTNPDDIKSQVLRSWPNAKIENWDTIVNQSIANGWNPAFVLTLWIEETGAQGASGGYSAALGCDINHTKYRGDVIEQQLECLFKNGAEEFADFMCIWGGDGFHKAPCVFEKENPNFPVNIKSWYSKLVPSGPGAIIILPTPTPGGPAPKPNGLLLSCPLYNPKITCGTSNNPVNGCGHGGIGYAKTCDPNLYECAANGQYTDFLKAAIDMTSADGKIYFPYVNGQKVTWYKNSTFTLNQGWGLKVLYRATTPDGGEIILNFTHVNNNPAPAESGQSGEDTRARLAPGAPNGPHLHTAFMVDGVSIDAIDAGMCQ